MTNTTSPLIALDAIRDFAAAILNDDATDSTLDSMQLRIDLMLDIDDALADLREPTDPPALTHDDISPDHFDALRAMHAAALDMRD